jgi:deoxyribodipyrimidine photo-lyase
MSKDNRGVSGRTALVLFTRDLRVHDHRGLSEAARTYDRILPSS